MRIDNDLLFRAHFNGQKYKEKKEIEFTKNKIKHPPKISS